MTTPHQTPDLLDATGTVVWVLRDTETMLGDAQERLMDAMRGDG